MNKQRHIILGAGIAGLACAIALARRGMAVSVYEQASEISEVGAGIQISPNGFAVLNALGLGAVVQDVGTPLQCVQLMDYRHPKPVLTLDMARYAPDQTYLALHRHDLIELLAEQAKAVGVEIHLGHRAVAVSAGNNETEVRFENGAAETAAVVIGADGLHSIVRDHVDGPQTPEFSGQVAWRATVAGQTGSTPMARVFMAPGQHVVTYPLRDGALTNIVAVEETSEWMADSWKAAGDPEKMRSDFGKFGNEISDLFGKVDAVNVWGLFRRPVAECWHRDGCVLIGDAAHPTLPFLAQGANLALEDAWVLTECLTSLQCDEALVLYQDRRKSRAQQVINAANANAGNFHLSHPLLRRLAHTALSIVGRIAPGYMVRRFDWIYRHDVTAFRQNVQARR